VSEDAAPRTAGTPAVTRPRVALFITCFNDLLFPQVGQAVVRLLERLDVHVEFPPEQTCCGQLHFNTGYRDEALALTRRFVRQFASYDRVVTPSASCAAMIRHHYPILAAEAGDPALVRDVAAISPRVRELTELLVDDLGVTDVGARFEGSVALHPTCHSLRLLDIGDRPRRLLAGVDGLTLVDLPGADQCCGFGGTFAVKNADVSTAMLADKMRTVLDTGAEIVTAGDNSCLMHIGGGLSRQRAGVRPMHLAEILAHTEEDARP
jgi:L-lactate dehydrogenase complex protein LldE